MTACTTADINDSVMCFTLPWVDINDLSRTSEAELAEEVDYILSSLDDYHV